MRSSIRLWQYRIDQLGLVGKIGLALVVASLLWAAAITVPLYLKISELGSSNDRLKSALARQTQAISADSETPVVPTKTSSSMDTALQKIFVAARSSGVRIDRGEYTVAGSVAGITTRYQVSLPVHGDYMAIRGFLSQVLNENSGLILEQARISRDQIEDTRLSASLRFMLVTGDAP